MSIINSFDRDGEEIIKAKDTVAAVQDFPQIVLSSFSANTTRLISSLFQVEQIGLCFCGFSISIWRFQYQGQTIAYYQSPIGGSAAVGILEQVIAMGAKKVLFFGSAGSLDKNLTGGNLKVPIAAYRDEGTSYHYAPPSDYIEIKTADKISEIFDELNIAYCKAKTWTTDAMYRETKGNMESRKAEGCIAVEQECASLIACGDLRGIDIHYFLYAADCLDGKTWDTRILGNMPDDMRERILRVALETAIRI